MILKSGFLLIELMVSITLFTFFLSAICSFQVLSLKNRDFATKRMLALNDLISEIEKAKNRNSVFNEENQKIIVENLPEFKLAIKNEKKYQQAKRKDKHVQLKKFSTQKELFGKKICKVSLVSI